MGPVDVDVVVVDTSIGNMTNGPAPSDPNSPTPDKVSAQRKLPILSIKNKSFGSYFYFRGWNWTGRGFGRVIPSNSMEIDWSMESCMINLLKSEMGFLDGFIEKSTKQIPTRNMAAEPPLRFRKNAGREADDELSADDVLDEAGKFQFQV